MINYEITFIDNFNHVMQIKYLHEDDALDFYINVNIPRGFDEETVHDIAKQNAFQAQQYWNLQQELEPSDPVAIENITGAAKPTIFEDPPEYNQGTQTITPVIRETEEAYIRSFEIRDYSAEEIAEAVRMKRNFLLQETDKEALADRDTPVEILEYRAALRDITSQPGFPYDLVWPIKPAE